MALDPARAPTGRLAPEAAGAYLGELFEQHGRMVYGVCRLMLHHRAEAEDAAQQSFLSAYRSLLNGHEPREPVPWLATIARNECRARLRGRMAEPLAFVDESRASTAEVESLVGQRAEIAALCETLAELPGPQRDAIVLREFYGLSYEEVSAVVGVSVPAVDALLVRARRRLQAELRRVQVASGALVIPLALRESLAYALPGFAAGGPTSGLVAKLASLPIAAKLAGAVATVAVVSAVGLAGPPSRGHAPAAGGASPVQVASTDVATKSVPGVSHQKVTVAATDDDAAATARARRDHDGDEDAAEDGEREGPEDRDDDEAERDEVDEPGEAEEPNGADKPAEPEDESASSSGSESEPNERGTDD